MDSDIFEILQVSLNRYLWIYDFIINYRVVDLSWDIIILGINLGEIFYYVLYMQFVLVFVQKCFQCFLGYLFIIFFIIL